MLWICRYSLWLMGYIGFVHAICSWSIPEWIRKLLCTAALIVYLIWNHEEDKKTKEEHNEH